MWPNIDMGKWYDNDNDNDNDNIVFDHNVQIEITIFNSLENQIINWSGDYYWDKLICHYHNSHQ